MSAQEMPDFLTKELSKLKTEVCHNNFKTGLPDQLLEVLEFGFLKCFEALSKPENAAKLPEVAKLVEACKPEAREVPNTILGEGFIVFSLNHEKINEALAPFKGGE